MQAADLGQLGTRERVTAEATRMLTDPRAVSQSARFITQWLDLDRLANLKPDPGRFAGFDSVLAGDMRRETLASSTRSPGNKTPALGTAQRPVHFRHAPTGPPLRSEATGSGLRKYDLSSSLPGRPVTQGPP
ncbi:MAG: hypothetical protein Ct9H300mP1_38600 [Planctomycetaceae bacterium]|nr:MAG: hypothetical protein Ct9H300mP1_38600 [Planctomycetaceae bacterium]